MRRIVIITSALLAGVPALAQRADLEAQKALWRQMVADTVPAAATTLQPAMPVAEWRAGTDSVPAAPGPTAQSYIPTALNYSPYGYAWGLHSGLNVEVGLSAFATFGKHVPHRGGFSQNINAAYVAPLTRNGKLWLAAGGYLNNTNWGGDSYRDAGLYALLGYRIDQHWEAYAYGQLSLASNYDRFYSRYWGYGPAYMGFCSPMGIGGTRYGMGMPGAKVAGGGVTYHFNRNFSLGVSVQGVWYDNQTPYYFDRRSYPLPPL
ncbi:hypothetical protein [Prevotella sp. kh1p2]|uniref:hypothetical protein n=1 Tax=Prevotella sp. kh1p2 TaxID=1761883 RepID=UPI0008CE1E4C|nr:hypothetical protein [Prevotella sp. kh1p2]SES95106.1 hypothetical protein SAMN04487825_10923 [Prevotella sp. kh1p2]SNU11269.1 hypothetical protein SAMN06298210_10923 [Prevotellaceae bacterium KH2P17]